jgi:transcriptional regulator GlxA family with amidase domain
VVWDDGGVQVALALFPGVSADECEAFTLVFDQIGDVELVGVGARLGPVEGQGGGHHVDALFSDVTNPDIVLVPGGLGCERTARDEELLGWLRAVRPGCEWMAASSTGTVVVAAAGLLDDREAATHWLASPLLESYGSRASTERIVEVGRVITCEGKITAMHVALLVTLRVFGPTTVMQVREALAHAGGGSAPRRASVRWPARRSRRHRAAARSGPVRPRNRELAAPDVIEFEPMRPTGPRPDRGGAAPGRFTAS